MSKHASTSGEQATELRYGLTELPDTLSDVISLGRGDPDLGTPRPILHTVLRELRRPLCAPPARGLPALREALAERYRRVKGLDLDPDREILITNGAQEGLVLSILALVDPEDRVLVPDPRYSSIDQAVEAAGGTRVQVPTGEDYDFALNPASLAERVEGAHPGGGFYIWADISPFGLSGRAFCRRLLEETRVLLFPGSSFGERRRGFVRFSLTQTEARLQEARERLESFIASLRGANRG